MAFREITKGTWSSPAAAHSITVGPSNSDSTVIRVSRDILRSMGMPSHVLVSIGTGPDAGLYLIEPATEERNAYKVNYPKYNAAGRVTCSKHKLGLRLSRPVKCVVKRLESNSVIFEVPQNEANKPAKQATRGLEMEAAE